MFQYLIFLLPIKFMISWFKIFYIYHIAFMTEHHHPFKADQYTDFPSQPYTFIADDFCHQEQFVLKETLKTQKSIIKLKQNVGLKNRKFFLFDETKLWFQLPEGASLYSKVQSEGQIKLHYHHGTTLIQNRPFFFYAGLNSNPALELLSIKFGVGHDSQHCHSDNRFKISGEQGKFNYHWYNKTMVYHRKYRFGLVTCFDLNNKVIQKNNLLLGYNIDQNTQGFLRAEVDGWRTHNASLLHPQNIWDKFTLDLIRNISDKAKAAIQIGYDVRNKSLNNIQAVFQIENSRSKDLVKFGVNQKLDIYLLLKKPTILKRLFEDRASVSIGLGVMDFIFKTEGGFKFNLNFGAEISINL